MDACISSSTRPFVSGTNKTAEPHMPENMKNVPGVVLPKNCFKLLFFFSKEKREWGCGGLVTCRTPFHRKVESVGYNPRTGPVRNSIPLSIAIS
jgi:hypothetical protein